MSNQTTIRAILEHGCQIRETIANNPAFLDQLNKAAEILIKCVKNNGTIYTCGNGGSSNDSMHFAEEMVARYKRERRGIKAMHFMDAAVLTCWSNDYSFETVFSRQVETFCTKNDVLVAFSTSGNSLNVIKAVEAAKKLNTPCIVLSGKDGGKLANVADVTLIVPANETERIQELHITFVHIFCELIETSI